MWGCLLHSILGFFIGFVFSIQPERLYAQEDQTPQSVQATQPEEAISYHRSYYQIEDYIRSQEDPEYAQYVDSKKMEKSAQKKFIEEYKEKKAYEEYVQERERMEYLLDRNQEKKDQSHLEKDYQVELEREHQKYLELQRRYVEEKRIQSSARSIASIGAPKKYAEFESSPANELKRVPPEKRKYKKKLALPNR